MTGDSVVPNSGENAQQPIDVKTEKMDDNIKTENLDDNVKTENLDEQFAEHKKVAAQAKAQFVQMYKQMIAQLSPFHLTPFAEVLREYEDVSVENWEACVNRVRSKVEEQMLGALDKFWDEFHVDESIGALEMLKDKFKKFEGKEWNMHNKTAKERTLPLRIRINDMKLRYMQRQLEFQLEQLQKLLKENNLRRERVQQVTQERERILEEVEAITSHYKHVMGEIDSLIDAAKRWG